MSTNIQNGDRRYRIAVDVGGTFTDLVIAGSEYGRHTFKTSSTPQDPPQAMLSGLALIASSLDVPVSMLLANTEAIVHGTTITTNAFLTRTGAKTGLITTGGFRDVLPMRRGHRDDQMNSKTKAPAPLVPRYLIREVGERIDRNGKVERNLAVEDVLAACEAFEHQRVTSVAVALMFSYLNPIHELEIASLIRKRLPDVFISLSSHVAPEVKLYERTSTTVLNAYVGPILQSYTDQLSHRLRQAGYDGPVLLMQSNGGVSLLEAAADMPVNTLLSGPAGGPVAAASIAESLKIPKAMTIDMGGTSFEASVSRNGITEVRSEGKLGGFAITTAMLDISTIGAGGGSIAWLSPGGELRVGPQSAGALPGPACYGRGGNEATVTDASLLLGFLNPQTFGNGQLKLDQAAATRAVAAIAAKLEISNDEAAAGIYATINASMTDSLRLATVNKGYDPREFAIIAAGGAGPIHAAELARDLEIELVIVPRDASVLCAAGMLDTDFIHYSVRSLVGRIENPESKEIQDAFGDLEQGALAQLHREGVASENVSFHRFAELRYVGQVHSLEIDFSAEPISDKSRDELDARFISLHRERFGHVLPEAQTEIVNLRLRTLGRFPRATFAKQNAKARAGDEEHLTRSAWFGGGFVDVPVSRGETLEVGDVIAGPALIELPMSTIVVPKDFQLRTETESYLLYPSGRNLSDVLEKLRRSGDAS